MVHASDNAMSQYPWSIIAAMASNESMTPHSVESFPESHVKFPPPTLRSFLSELLCLPGTFSRTFPVSLNICHCRKSCSDRRGCRDGIACGNLDESARQNIVHIQNTWYCEPGVCDPRIAVWLTIYRSWWIPVYRWDMWCNLLHVSCQHWIPVV